MGDDVHEGFGILGSGEFFRGIGCGVERPGEVEADAGIEFVLLDEGGQEEQVADVLEIGEGIDFFGELRHLVGHVLGDFLGGVRSAATGLGVKHLGAAFDFQARAAEGVGVAGFRNEQWFILRREPETGGGGGIGDGGLKTVEGEFFYAEGEALEAVVGGEHRQGEAGCVRYADDADGLGAHCFLHFFEEFGAWAGAEFFDDFIGNFLRVGDDVEGAAIIVLGGFGVDGAQGHEQIIQLQSGSAGDFAYGLEGVGEVQRLGGVGEDKVFLVGIEVDEIDTGEAAEVFQFGGFFCLASMAARNFSRRRGRET